VRILWVKAGKILPVDTGGKIRSFNLLRELAARHQTTFLSYYSGAVDRDYETDLVRKFPGALAVHAGGAKGIVGETLNYARHLPSPTPYAVQKFTSPRVRHLIEAGMRERRHDVIVCDFLSASRNFPRELTTPTALFQHNVESALWERQASHEQQPLKRFVFGIEARKMARYERAAVARFHHIIAVSQHDRDLMSTMTDASRISVAPTGVDLGGYRGAADSEPTEPLVVFVGSMDWEANVDGVFWFHENVWPRIRSIVPAAKLRIVGRKPSTRVRKLADNLDVEVTGEVPSVVDHLAEAAAVIVPLRVGGGTRLKIYEAMAAGRAVVSTRVGAEGLDVNDGRDIILADEPQAFADAVAGLLNDPTHRRSIAVAAAAQAARFDWPAVVRQFETALARTIEDASRHAGIASKAAFA